MCVYVSLWDVHLLVAVASSGLSGIRSKVPAPTRRGFSNVDRNPCCSRSSRRGIYTTDKKTRAR